MPQSTILIDIDRLLNDQKATKVVEKVTDYPDAYLALREAIHNDSCVTLYVRHPTVAIWLKQCADSYGDQLIALRFYTPRVPTRYATRLCIQDE
jgi:hypothetical protein